MDLKYITRVLGGTSMKRMLHCAELVCARTKKSRLGVILDMLACAKRYGAGYYDYLIFEFDKMTKAQRATYMTRFTNKKLMGMMNDPEYTALFDEKHQFYQHFSEFLGRDFVSLSQCSRDELKAFLAGKTQIIAKPTEGECGKGIEKLQVSDFADADAPKNLKRRLTSFEYGDVLEYALSLGFDGFSQDLTSATSKYTPEF